MKRQQSIQCLTRCQQGNAAGFEKKVLCRRFFISECDDQIGSLGRLQLIVKVASSAGSGFICFVLASVRPSDSPLWLNLFVPIVNSTQCEMYIVLTELASRMWKFMIQCVYCLIPWNQRESYKTFWNSFKSHQFSERHVRDALSHRRACLMKTTKKSVYADPSIGYVSLTGNSGKKAIYKV